MIVDLILLRYGFESMYPIFYPLGAVKEPENTVPIVRLSRTGAPSPALLKE